MLSPPAPPVRVNPPMGVLVGRKAQASRVTDGVKVSVGDGVIVKVGVGLGPSVGIFVEVGA